MSYKLVRPRNQDEMVLIMKHAYEYAHTLSRDLGLILAMLFCRFPVGGSLCPGSGMEHNFHPSQREVESNLSDKPLGTP